VDGTAEFIRAGVLDYRGRYVIHCHNLEHEDMAMMATINVI
jgi:FtsP/CotA-like multicopper oxidase with cupredoxin domain